MFRKGGTLNADFTPDVDSLPDTIRMDKGHNLIVSDSIVIFDAEKEVGSGQEEYAMVMGITSQIGYDDVLLNADLQRSYNAGLTALDKGAGIGVPSAGTFNADLSQLYKSFDEAYVEFVVRPDGGAPVPYSPPGALDTEPQLTAFSSTWFKNSGGGNATNYIHVIGVGFATGSTLGATVTAHNYSFIYTGKIETLAQPPDNLTLQEVSNVLRLTTTHEIGHQFRLNTNDVGGHDTRGAWCSGVGQPCAGEPCLMKASLNTSSAFDKNNVHEFCVEDLTSADPPNSVRREPEKI